MTGSDVEVWLFHPAGMPARIKRMIESECAARRWSLTPPRQTRRVQTPEGRPLGLIASRDAINLYRRAHRARVGVFQIGDAHVPIKPHPRSTVRDYVRLRGFVRHKAFHVRIPQNAVDSQWSSSLATFQRWLDGTWCDGEGDPRCLPFHVFETDFETSRLSSAEDRSAFEQMHGPQSSRVDDRQLRWARPPGAHHGRETLHVSGYGLIRGFHWDVSSERGKSVTTISGTWEIHRGGHVNVYPDAYIREGRSSRRITSTKKAKAR